MKYSTIALTSVLGLAGIAKGAQLPAEFDTPGTELSRLFSYFGGVAGFQVSHSSNTVFDGGSMQIDVQFQPSIFSTNGVAIGDLSMTGAEVGVEPGADRFSITIEAPTSGTLSFYVTVREDDNGDGVVDLNADDEWESPNMILQPGTNVYDISYSQFVLSGESNGDEIFNVNDAQAIGLILTFETSAANPGGTIVEPVTFWIDHVGFYAGPQSIPSPEQCVGDVNSDSVVNLLDLNVVLGNFNSIDGLGDLTGDGLTNINDLNVVLGNFGTSCP